LLTTTLTVKADYAIGTDAEGLGEILDSSSLKIDHYLNTIIQRMDEAIGPQRCCMVQYWSFIFGKLKEWHKQHQEWRSRREKTGPKQSTPRKSASQDDDAVAERSNTAVPAAGTEALTFVTTIRAGDSLHQQQQPEPSQYVQAPIAPEAPGTTSLPSWSGSYDFGIGSSLQPHPGPQAQPQQQPQALPSQPLFNPSTISSLGDFETALQHGDLYLWTDEMGGGFSSFMDIDSASGIQGADFGDGWPPGFGDGVSGI
jgi:hypothetical protein